MSKHAETLLDFVNEFGHLWDDERVDQVELAADEINILEAECQRLKAICRHIADMASDGTDNRVVFIDDGSGPITEKDMADTDPHND